MMVMLSACGDTMSVGVAYCYGAGEDQVYIRAIWMGLVRAILGQIQIKLSHHLTHRHATQWEPDRTRGGLISTRRRCSNRLWRLWRNIK
jgi:hypothetical protein